MRDVGIGENVFVSVASDAANRRIIRAFPFRAEASSDVSNAPVKLRRSKGDLLCGAGNPDDAVGGY